MSLNVAASAVSRQIIELEAQVGETLLERLPRGVVPTEAGRLVAEHAQRQADEAALLEGPAEAPCAGCSGARSACAAAPAS
ncbi:MAG: LysR family transcriptional regulator [Methylobacterium radiotolerans]